MAQAARLTGAGAAALALWWGAPAAAADWTVQTYLDSFEPHTLTVAEGDTVTWVNRTPARHYVQFERDPRDGAAVPWQRELAREPVTLTARVAGRYPYRCPIHGMYGTLVVLAADGAQ